MVKVKKANTRVGGKKRRKLRKRIYFILVPFLVFLTALGYATYLYIKADSVLSESYENDGREKSDLREEKVDPLVDNVSVLIIGVDENQHRDNAENSRSDTLILATLNKDENSVKMLSIPRDSYVYIPELGYEDKITHAHAFGGTQATIETVENLLDIPVDYYVKVNFEAFVDVVDAIDGITVEVPYEFKESNSQDKRDSIHLLPGKQLLDGEEALALARTRKKDNDIERGKRQMEIIKAVVDKATSLQSILKFDNIIEAVGSNMTTNMTFSEMKTFISYGTSAKNLKIDSMTLEGYDYQPANVYYWQVDEVALDETRNELKDHLDINDTTTVNQYQDGTENADGTVDSY